MLLLGGGHSHGELGHGPYSNLHLQSAHAPTVHSSSATHCSRPGTHPAPVLESSSVAAVAVVSALSSVDNVAVPVVDASAPEPELVASAPSAEPDEPGAPDDPDEPASPGDGVSVGSKHADAHHR